MKVFFSEKNRQKILESIKIAMGDRKLAEIVNFSLETGRLEVKISKFGTSVLDFAESETEKGLEYCLTSEKIALTHRGLKDEVKAKIVECIEKAGGQVKG